MPRLDQIRDLLWPGVQIAGYRAFPTRDTDLCRGAEGDIPRIDWEIRTTPDGGIELNIWHHDLPRIEDPGHGAQTRLFPLASRQEIEDETYKAFFNDRVTAAFHVVRDELTATEKAA